MFCNFLSGVNSSIHNKFGNNDRLLSVFIANDFALTRPKLRMAQT